MIKADTSAFLPLYAAAATSHPGGQHALGLCYIGAKLGLLALWQALGLCGQEHARQRNIRSVEFWLNRRSAMQDALLCSWQEALDDTGTVSLPAEFLHRLKRETVYGHNQR